MTLRHALGTVAFGLGTVVLVGCPPESTDGSNTDSTTTEEADLNIEQENVYTYTADLSLSTVEVQEKADVEVCWDTLTTDIRGRAVVPSEIDQSTIAKMQLPQAEVETAINENGLLQSDIFDYRDAYPVAQTCINLSEHEILGNVFVPSSDFTGGDDVTWIFTLWKTSAVGKEEIINSVFLKPVSTSTETHVDITDTMSTLDFSIDLHTAKAVSAPAGNPDLVVSWGSVLKDASGNLFSSLVGDTLLLAHVPVETIGEVESSFLKLDTAADQTYYLDAYGKTQANLGDAKDLDGNTFGGFTTDGIWLIGIECTEQSCFSPAPLILTVVEVQ